jgi:predicted nuclease with TOPRIM domain
MGSSSKRQTTMAKMAREQAVRERRLRKQARKEARKQAAAGDEGGQSETPSTEDGNRASLEEH